MAEFPALPLWTDRYLADTTHLADAEHGRYFLILMHLWRTPRQRFPNDIAWLARKFGRSVEAFEIEVFPIMREFCQCDGNWWTQKRLSAEWEYVKKTKERQRDNANARWNKEKDRSHGNATLHQSGNAPTPTPTPTPKESLVLACEDDIDKAFQSFNETAQKCGLPRAAKLTAARKAKLKARLNGHGLSLWLEALGKIEASPFLRGENKNGWRADLDFMLQESSFNKLVEGSYDRPNANVVPEQSAPRSPPPRSSRHELRDADG